MKAADGLSHHGDPAEEEEVIVVEEPERPKGGEPRVVRAPRVPTQGEFAPMMRHTYHTRSGVKPAWQGGHKQAP